MAARRGGYQRQALRRRRKCGSQAWRVRGGNFAEGLSEEPAGTPRCRRELEPEPLLDELPNGVRLDEATAAVLAYIREHVPEPSKAPLAGNTVHMDRLFLARDMPDVEGWLHYRNVDVSSIKELVRRWFPRVYFASPTKTGNHRALGDIQDSIDELRYYRMTAFVPIPGPTSEEAKAAAAAVLAGETRDPRVTVTE